MTALDEQTHGHPLADPLLARLRACAARAAVDGGEPAEAGGEASGGGDASLRLRPLTASRLRLVADAPSLYRIARLRRGERLSFAHTRGVLSFAGVDGKSRGVPLATAAFSASGHAVFIVERRLGTARRAGLLRRRMDNAEEHASGSGGVPVPLAEWERTAAEAIGVDAVLEIGTIFLSLAEIVSLTPGRRIEYCFDPETPVRLSVGGEAIATGRFIEADGALQFEITEVLPAPRPRSQESESTPQQPGEARDY